jgi:hypothetical protein
VENFGLIIPRDMTVEDKIVKTIDLQATVDRVWRAVTDHNEFGEWFRVALEKPFAVGEQTAGNITYPGYEHIGSRLWSRPWTQTPYSPSPVSNT